MDSARHKQMVGSRLRSAIEALGLRPAQVGREMGVSQQKIGNWLRGDHYPDEWFVYRFCNRYGITTDWLYRGIVSGVPQALAAALFAAEEASQEASEEEAGPGQETP